MRALFISIAFLLTTCSLKAITAQYTQAIFFDAEHGQYLETHLLFDGLRMRYKAVDELNFQARAELTLILRRDGKIADFKKTYVLSPMTTDTVNLLSDFVDIQRFKVSPGTYELSLRLQDVNNPIDTAVSIQSITIDAISGNAFFSDIVLVYPPDAAGGSEALGTPYLPRVSTYYAPGNDHLHFYTELYATAKALGAEADYLLVLELKRVPGGETMENYRIQKRMKAKGREPLRMSFGIADLPTGEYTLSLEVRSRTNEKLCSKTQTFKRFNTVSPTETISENLLSNTFVQRLSEDSLREMAHCLRYVGSAQEEHYIDTKVDTLDSIELRRFFYNFWYTRNPADPRLEWSRYFQLIEVVQREYNTSTNHGCETDRGRIYLTYGKPTSITRVPNEPYAYPYEIWHYAQTQKKANAKFVFLDNMHTNDYALIQSNVLGERSDYNWFTRIALPNLRPSTTDEMFDSGVMPSTNDVGFRALEYYNNPR